MKTIDTLNPRIFRKICMSVGELPTSYMESMTYYEMVAWLCEYIKNNVVTTLNNHAEAIKEIQDWIETLDLQDEVDDKLERMAEDGTLARLINEVLFDELNARIDNLEDDVTQLENSQPNLNTNVSIAPLMYADSEGSDQYGHQGSWLVDKLLYVYHKTSDYTGEVERYNLESNLKGNSIANVPGYHGNLVYLNGKLYFPTDYTSEGVEGNKVISIYNIEAGTSTEINPFSSLTQYSTLCALCPYDDNNLICVLRLDSSNKSITNCAITKLNLIDYTFTTPVQVSNDKNIRLSMFSNQGICYKDGYLYSLASQPEQVIKMSYSDTKVNVEQVYILPKYDEMGIPIGEVEGISPADSFGKGNFIITNQGQANGSICYAWLINFEHEISGEVIPHLAESTAWYFSDRIYVDSNSTSLYENGTETYPFKKIVRAMQFYANTNYNATNIYVKPGSYELPAQIMNFPKPLSFYNNGNNTVNITTKLRLFGSEAYFHGQAYTNGFVFSNSNEMEIKNSKLKLDYCQVPNAAISLYEQSNVSINHTKTGTNKNVTCSECSQLIVGDCAPNSGTGTIVTNSNGVTMVANPTTATTYTFTTTGSAILIKPGTYSAR